MSLIIHGATVIDGASDRPVSGRSILLDGATIRAIETPDALPAAPEAQVIEAHGKFVIPGLLNANVHLFSALNLECILEYRGRYQELIEESAQVALKSGLTTVFDTWGPRRDLMAVRDRIDRGEIPGARIFCAGNIIGFDGPFSEDFLSAAAGLLSPVTSKPINAIWVENVGRHLMWLTPDQVAAEVRKYLATGIDFVKFASNDHAPGAFLAFSPRVQAAIVEEAHRAGTTAQSHSMSVEGLAASLEAGCDLVTHCNITGPTPIPVETLEMFVQRGAGAVVFAWTARAMEWIEAKVSERERVLWRVSDENARALIASDAMLLMANDGSIYPREMAEDPAWADWSVCAPQDNMFNLADGHFSWLVAMEEKGCPPMRMLQAATANIAKAYGKFDRLGSLAPGKAADLLILDKNPLEAAANYRSISTVIKDGLAVDRNALPLRPRLTAPAPRPPPEAAVFRPFISAGQFPLCPMCMRR